MGKSAVNISVNKKTFKVGCPSGEESALIASSKELDKRLSELLKTGQYVNTEQALLMTALNLTNELLKLQQHSAQEKIDAESKIALLQSTFEHALSKQSIKRA